MDDTKTRCAECDRVTSWHDGSCPKGCYQEGTDIATVFSGSKPQRA